MFNIIFNFKLMVMLKNPVLLIIIVSCSACSDKLAKTKAISDSSLSTELTSPSDALTGQAELNFFINEGKIHNKFFRQGKVAAHTLLKSGTSPRIVVAFPAGNSGVSLWFNSLEQPMQWQEIQQISALHEANNDDEPLYGIEAKIITFAKQLEVKQAILSNVRVIRDYLQTGGLASEVKNSQSVNEQRVTWYRDRLDGKAGYKLEVEVIQGKVSGGNGKPVIFTADKDLPLVFKIKALSGEKPLTPILKNDLLTANNDQDETTKNILAFLSYQEKLLAGSWRFATYFGRDTLMSVRLLMPVLNHAVIEAGLGSVIERLNNRGEVAHEEDIAEFAVIRHLRETGQPNEQEFYDYKMIDDDYLLAPIIAEYLLNQDTSLTAAKAFLSRKTKDGQLYSERLLANFNYVMLMASPYAKNPIIENLININQGDTVGEWRDSGEGLGFGRIPYNVNAVFVPAALKAISQLIDSGLFSIDNAVTTRSSRTKSMAKVWQQNAPVHFKVTLTNEIAKQSIQQHAQQSGVPQNMALSSIGAEPLTFNALSLDKQGKPIAVIHSDDGFTMLFSKPSETELLNIIKVTLRPYPAGLLTPVGMLVANPVYAKGGLKQHFSNQHYHGEVIWSWQQALFAAGLERQLLRDDLSQNAKDQLMIAQEKLWQVINATNEINNAELWSWSFKNGQYHIESFGQRSGDKTESNAAQLWSTVYLAIKSPNQ
jgi:hypothetical protein